MKEISVINFIEVPKGMEDEAIQVRNIYVDYFRKQEGFVSSTFFRSLTKDEWHKYVNIVVWKSQEHFKHVVNLGFDNSDGENNEGMKVLGKGFPSPIRVSPSQYEIIGN
ncbi:MAG: antibiotic biosynthesis monooxygenase [Pseudomonadales bacterium]|nr:antibiotic biosynthesis monooxygenase [Pseudomonadales bacterium]